MGYPETPPILSVLVLEDLTMALYLPLVAVLLVGQGWGSGLVAILVALATVSVVLFVAVRYGRTLSRLAAHQSDEVILFTTLGVVLLIAGVAQRLQVSAAIGAFLVGIALSGPIVKQTYRLISPLRDLFAAIFFLFLGLQIDPSTLPPVLVLAVGLGVLTTLTKVLTGWWAARRAGVDTLGSLRGGAALVARGEFSIVIAGLGVTAGIEPQLGPLSAAYVLFMAVLGPILARTIEPITARSWRAETPSPPARPDTIPRFPAASCARTTIQLPSCSGRSGTTPRNGSRFESSKPSSGTSERNASPSTETSIRRRGDASSVARPRTSMVRPSPRTARTSVTRGGSVSTRNGGETRTSRSPDPRGLAGSSVAVSRRS